MFDPTEKKFSQIGAYTCNESDIAFMDGSLVKCQKENGEVYIAAHVQMRAMWKILPLISYLFMIIVNILANIIPFNGITTGDVANKYENLLTPAPITFGIWFVIYILLTVQLVGYLRSDRFEPDFMFYTLANIANGIWIFLWHYDLIFISLIVMVVLFATLLITYLIHSPVTEMGGLYTLRVPSWKSIPTSVYFGWISVALAANVTVFLVSIKTDWTLQGVWTAVVLVILVIIGMTVATLKGDIFYLMVIMWATIGVILKRFSVTPLNIVTVTTALIGLTILSLVLGVTLFRQVRGIRAFCATTE